jgi:hypothetical protein
MSEQRLENARNGKHGMPCTKQFLKYNTEYTEKPICTASKQYKNKKLAELSEQNLSAEAYQVAYDTITEKECLCVGLGVSLLESIGIEVGPTDKVTVCPGPNLAYFSKESSLKEMVDHIYGRINLLDNRHRPHMFTKELGMYLDIFKKRMESFLSKPDDAKEKKQLTAFQKNITEGVNYYFDLFKEKKKEVVAEIEQLMSQYPILKKEL